MRDNRESDRGRRSGKRRHRLERTSNERGLSELANDRTAKTLRALVGHTFVLVVALIMFWVTHTAEYWLFGEKGLVFLGLFPASHLLQIADATILCVLACYGTYHLVNACRGSG